MPARRWRRLTASGSGTLARAQARGTFELHFFLHEALVPDRSAFSCYLRVRDVDAMFEAFRRAGLPERGIPRMDPVADKPWGMREFAVVDEDGTLVRIGQVIGAQP